MVDENDLPKMSKTERRKKFDSWRDKGMLADQWREGKLDKLTFYPNIHSREVERTVKIMSNKDRRERGWEQDPDLEDYQVEEKKDAK